MSFVCRPLLILLVSAVLTASRRGQVLPTASLSGTITDRTEAVVPNASLAIRNADTRFTKSTKTDSHGNFLFMLMPPGQYELSVSAPGFSTYNQAGISLDVNLS